MISDQLISGRLHVKPEMPSACNLYSTLGSLDFAWMKNYLGRISSIRCSDIPGALTLTEFDCALSHLIGPPY